MRKNILIKSGVMSSILFLQPMACHAEWTENSNGWRYSSQNSYTTGWQMINDKWYYFSNEGYMQTGWIQTDGRWYYMYQDGSMAKNTNIDGYTLGSDGAWIEKEINTNINTNTETDSTSNVDVFDKGKLSNISTINFDDINKIEFFDVCNLNTPLTLTNKEQINEFLSIINDTEVENIPDENLIGWKYKLYLYNSKNETLRITFTDPLYINNKSYKITNGDSDLIFKQVTNFLESIDS